MTARLRTARPPSLRAGAWLVAALVLLTMLSGPVHAAAAGVELRVLVVSDSSPSVEAIATQMDREGVPYTRLSLLDSARPRVTSDLLVDASTGRGRYQAVVLPNQAGGGLSPEELEALTTYERAYGVRQVNAHDYPGASMGLQTPTYSGSLDGASATVTTAGREGPFGYLRGPVQIDDFASGLEVYGYVAVPSSTPAQGESFTPLVTVEVPEGSGALVGVHARDGREELVLTAAYNGSMQWFNALAHGVITWMTRGIHLGYQRNYLAVQVDDVLLPDGRWSVAGNCTPGDDCVDPDVRTDDIRMTPADVDRLRTWQQANGLRLDMVFNGAGETQAEATGSNPDPLTAALVAAQSDFRWVNHTLSHTYLGCIQIAPTAQGGSWRCATGATEQPRQDPDVPQELSGGTYWASSAYLEGQVRDNISFAQRKGFTDFDPAELVTGEHSGLRVLPQQPQDSPFLGPVLDAVGVRWTASDASREPAPRGVGLATTVPRHPMNVFYNTATYQELIDEYNWYYTRAADGGGGICEANPASTCITPLAAGDPAAARASFDSYLKPLEVRNALSKVLTNDPRPFYAHQSNLAEDGLLYPVLDGVLGAYSAMYDRAVAPLVQLDLTGQGEQLTQMSAWRSAAPAVTAYVDRSGVHVSGTGSIQLTVPAGTTVVGGTLESYGGELSGWVTGAVTAVTPLPAGGYVDLSVTVPAAPAGVTAVAGDGAATVSWLPPADSGGAPVTSYTVRGFAEGATEPVVTATATATTTTLTGLTNGVTLTFDVAATNSAGTGAPSPRSNAVTPLSRVPGAPAITAVTPKDAAIEVSWTPPAAGGPVVTGYTARAYVGDSASPATTVDVAADMTSAVLTGLVNGTAYTVDVAARSAAGTGPASARSAAVTPTALATVPGAPTIGPATAGDGSATVTWTAPADQGASALTGFTVLAYASGVAAPVSTTRVAPSSTSTVVGDLVNGTAYSFEVVATNGDGDGAASARSNAVTPSAAAAPGPGTPTTPGGPQVPVPPTTPGGPQGPATPPTAAGPTTTRLAGADRFATAARVSAAAFADGADHVIVVTGENWPDALAGGAAAAEVDGPVLPVRRSSLPAVIAAELDRLRPQRVSVLGGASAVSDSVVQALRTRGLVVERVSGADRYGTAAAVAARFFVAPTGAYYASGESFADALGGSAAAAQRGWPLLVVRPQGLSPATPVVAGERVVLGGPAAVADSVVARLGARRVAGPDRYATAAAVARDAFPRAATVHLTTGLDFPDALAGAPAAARDRAPILLAARDCVTAATRDTASALAVERLVVLGGTAAVSERAAALTPC